MPLVSITRLKPADLQEVQIQTTTNALISQVITSLQSNVSTEEIPLNTSCPTCVVADVPTGFVNATFQTKSGTVTLRVPCPTCKGYLLYHTADGPIVPPVNPFGDPLVVHRLLPADLRQALIGFPASTRLDTMIVSLQANYDVPPTYNCPKCVHTGWVTIQTKKVFCPLCVGVQKTLKQFELVDGIVQPVIPVIPVPDPPLAPPLTPPF